MAANETDTVEQKLEKNPKPSGLNPLPQKDITADKSAESIQSLATKMVTTPQELTPAEPNSAAIKVELLSGGPKTIPVEPKCDQSGESIQSQATKVVTPPHDMTSSDPKTADIKVELLAGAPKDELLAAVQKEVPLAECTNETPLEKKLSQVALKKEPEEVALRKAPEETSGGCCNQPQEVGWGKAPEQTGAGGKKCTDPYKESQPPPSDMTQSTIAGCPCPQREVHVHPYWNDPKPPKYSEGCNK